MLYEFIFEPAPRLDEQTPNRTRTELPGGLAQRKIRITPVMAAIDDLDPMEQELMSSSPAQDETPACQARLASGTHCTMRPSSSTM